MDTSDVLSLIEQLDDDIDDLEDSLAPFLKTALSETTSKLPLLDKAKLYVLITYAIESMLFSYLRLNGVNAREHLIFTELTRVRQYFDKIKLVETPVGTMSNLKLDKTVARRFYKADLAGNDKWDLNRAQQLVKERAGAHIKFEELSEKMELDASSKKRKIGVEGEQQASAPDADSASDSLGSNLDSESSTEERDDISDSQVLPKKKQKLRMSATQNGQDDSLSTSEFSKDSSASEKSKRDKKEARFKKRSKKSNKDKRAQ